MEEQRNLLIVDDEEDVCLLLKRSFRREFKTVETAHLLQDALEVELILHAFNDFLCDPFLLFWNLVDVPESGQPLERGHIKFVQLKL